MKIKCIFCEYEGPTLDALKEHSAMCPGHPKLPPDWMIVDATRYAIGWRSYQVGETVKWLVANWGRLSDYARGVIRNHVEQAFDRDDLQRLACWEHTYLGDDADRREWEQVRALWAAGAVTKPG